MDIRSNTLASCHVSLALGAAHSELFLFALILVLPQVDLPDFTFRDGGAPASAHVQWTSPPAGPVSIVGSSARLLLELRQALPTFGSFAPPLQPSERRSLLCALLC
jgi:hypothetical protein